jgi:hypothetical protein
MPTSAAHRRGHSVSRIVVMTLALAAGVVLHAGIAGAERADAAKRCSAKKAKTGSKSACRKRSCRARPGKSSSSKRRARRCRRRVNAKAAQVPRFAPNSVWNVALPRSAQDDSSSSSRMGGLADDVEAKMSRGLYPNIAGGSYSTPVYVVSASQPKVQVTIDAGPWATPFKDAVAAGVPIPPNATPAKGTDGHMTVYQPSADRLWEFWKAAKRQDGWHASWGGAMRNVSSNPGYYSNAVWPGLSKSQGWNWGSTATSIPVSAGLITMAELRLGRIDHALAAAIPVSCQSAFAFPAQRKDGSSRASDCVPEGARIRIDPRVDIESLSMPRITRIIARAAQKYGMIVRDTTGGGSFSLYAEGPRFDDPSPYVGPTSLFGGVPGWNTLTRFPWRALQLMPMKLCTKAPCLPD